MGSLLRPLGRSYSGAGETLRPTISCVLPLEFWDRWKWPPTINAHCPCPFATYDEVERVALSKHPIWAPLVGLISWSVPIALKAELVQTRAALGKSYRPSTANMRQPNVNRQILRLFAQNKRITNEIRQGFVNCLILIERVPATGGRAG
uniref:Nuclear pore complex protein Nup205 n=1 Tax=Culex pipiens TaxID=7175 RepID=A0A8D8C6L4_CULPI